MKKFLSATLSFLLLVSLLCACGSGSAPKTGYTPKTSPLTAADFVGELTIRGDASCLQLLTMTDSDTAVYLWDMLAQLEANGCEFSDFSFKAKFNSNGTFTISPESYADVVSTQKATFEKVASWADEDTANVITFATICGNTETSLQEYDEEKLELLKSLLTGFMTLASSGDDSFYIEENYTGKFKYQNGRLYVCHLDEDIDAIRGSFTVSKSGSVITLSNFDYDFSADVLGTWTVLEGSDDHELIIYADNTLEFVDGSDRISANYTFKDKCITLSSTDEDISCFSFCLKNRYLIRYENGEEDGYRYKKAE